jgi:hypothetical protein
LVTEDAFFSHFYLFNMIYPTFKSTKWTFINTQKKAQAPNECFSACEVTNKNTKKPSAKLQSHCRGRKSQLRLRVFVLWGLFLPLERDIATNFADGVGMLVFISAMKWFALVRLLTREETEAALLL